MKYLLKLIVQCKTSYVACKVLNFGVEKSVRSSVVRETNIFYCSVENLFSLTPALNSPSSCNYNKIRIKSESEKGLLLLV